LLPTPATGNKEGNAANQEQIKPISRHLVFRKDNPFPNLRGVSDTVVEEWTKINSGLGSTVSPLRLMKLNIPQANLANCLNPVEPVANEHYRAPGDFFFFLYLKRRVYLSSSVRGSIRPEFRPARGRYVVQMVRHGHAGWFTILLEMRAEDRCGGNKSSTRSDSISIVMCQLRYELASGRRVLPEMRTARAVDRKPRSPGDGPGRVHGVFAGTTATPNSSVVVRPGFTRGRAVGHNR
jgi:hypothetical protein